MYLLGLVGRRDHPQAQVPQWSILLRPHEGTVRRSSTRGAEAEEGRTGRLPRDASRARVALHLSPRLRGSSEAALAFASPDASAVVRVPQFRRSGGPSPPPAGRPHQGSG
ncbi:hypothetical protein NDU88_005015 [Pleurodeles waltl]|uniref:Uncharacterized protein n=1 Tax=Pleurodeles waltl TaxID=8319 RepID=A0AAV7WX34_PLEWA|nr:hypothetical protein NDU88_005015 [Pleurodeles waltl]